MSHARYWNQARLLSLVGVLQSLGFCQGDQWYLGPEVTAWEVHQAARRAGFRHILSETQEGLNVLLHMQVLAPGVGGARSSDYRRPFYPHVMQAVTDEHLAAYYSRRIPTERPTYTQPDDPAAPLALGVRPGMEYWTAARLSWLIGLLCGVAGHDQGGWYFGADPMRQVVHEVLRPYGYALEHTDTPINMLVFLGVLAPGKSGRKSRGYRRAFYPDVAVTDEGTRRYCEDVRARMNDQ